MLIAGGNAAPTQPDPDYSRRVNASDRDSFAAL
jgi:hypothetical protein